MLDYLVGIVGKSAQCLGPLALMYWLNTYIETMAQVIIDHHGIIDDYAGDAIKANFGVPLARETPQEIACDATHAIHCALRMVQELEKLNMSLSQQGLPTF